MHVISNLQNYLNNKNKLLKKERHVEICLPSALAAIAGQIFSLSPPQSHSSTSILA